MIVLALDLGGAHSPLDRELRKIKRKIRALDAGVQENKNGVQENKNNITQIKNTPTTTTEDNFLFVCGAQNMASSGIIRYDKLMINYTNIANPGGLNPSTGVFTAPVDGIYVVSYSMMNWADYNDVEVVIYLRLNSTEISETREISRYSAPSGAVKEGFGRELPLYLPAGETLDLYWKTGTGGIYDITFCLTLAKAVTGPYPSPIFFSPFSEEVADADKNNNTRL